MHLCPQEIVPLLMALPLVRIAYVRLKSYLASRKTA